MTRVRNFLPRNSGQNSSPGLLESHAPPIWARVLIRSADQKGHRLAHDVDVAAVARGFLRVDTLRDLLQRHALDARLWRSACILVVVLTQQTANSKSRLIQVLRIDIQIRHRACAIVECKNARGNLVGFCNYSKGPPTPSHRIPLRPPACTPPERVTPTKHVGSAFPQSRSLVKKLGAHAPDAKIPRKNQWARAPEATFPRKQQWLRAPEAASGKPPRPPRLRDMPPRRGNMPPHQHNIASRRPKRPTRLPKTSFTDFHVLAFFRLPSFQDGRICLQHCPGTAQEGDKIAQKASMTAS